MRLGVVVVMMALVGASAGCRVCVGACQQTQGRAVAGIVPRPDGTIVVTTCDLTTKGKASSLARCREVVIPPAAASTPGAAP